MAENVSGSQSTYSLAPALRLPKVKSAPSAYAQSLGLTDTVVLREVVHVIDDFGLPEFTAVAAGFGQERYGYVVTPNVDHLIRYYEDPTFRAQYRAADFILMDSRFAARLVRLLKGVRLPICTGSDLTAQLLSGVVKPTDRIVMIGGGDAPLVRVTALATVHDRDLQLNTDRFIRQATLKTGAGWNRLPRRIVSAQAWHWVRIYITLTPVCVEWWPDGRMDGPARSWWAPTMTAPARLSR